MTVRMGRKQFLRLSLAVVGAKLVGCGDDDGPARLDAGDDVDQGVAGEDMAVAEDMATAGEDMGSADEDMGSTEEDMGAPTSCSGDVIVADVSQNHGHTLEIPVADIVAGVEKTYVTGGTTGHCHVVTLTAADFAMLQAGGEVRVVSCNNTEHEYALSCAGTVTANDPAPTCGTSEEGRYPMGMCSGETFTP